MVKEQQKENGAQTFKKHAKTNNYKKLKHINRMFTLKNKSLRESKKRRRSIKWL